MKSTVPGPYLNLMERIRSAKFIFSNLHVILKLPTSQFCYCDLSGMVSENVTLSKGCKGDLELTKGIKRIRLESPGDSFFWRALMSNFGSDFGVDLDTKDTECWKVG